MIGTRSFIAKFLKPLGPEEIDHSLFTDQNTVWLSSFAFQIIPYKCTRFFKE